MALVFGSVEVEVGFGEKRPGESETDLGANKFALAAFDTGFGVTMSVEDEDSSDLVGDLGTCKVPIGLKRGASPLDDVTDRKGAIFFCPAVVGVSTMFLKILEVVDPVESSLILAVFNRLPSCSSSS